MKGINIFCLRNIHSNVRNETEGIIINTIILSIFFFLFFCFICPVSADFTNGDFESGDLSGWLDQSNKGNATVTDYSEYTGIYGVELIQDSYNGITVAELRQDGVNVDGYNFISWDMRVVSATGDADSYYVQVFAHPSHDFYQCWNVPAGGYKHYEYSLGSLSGSQIIRFYAFMNQPADKELTVYFDNIKLTQDTTLNVITLNQSIYNAPENIQMNAELGDYDPTNFSYTTRLYGYTYGGWGALTQVEYNESTAMTASNKSIVADINYGWYDLPLYIKAVLTQFNKTDYTTTEIAESDAVYYLAEDTTSAGTIEFNQSYYIEPEVIKIDVELTTYNFTDYSYYIITEVSEDLDYWDNVAGTYNSTTKITTTTAARILDVDTWLYDLPIWIISRLVAYDKLSGDYTTLDTTPAVLYNPPVPGSIKFGGTVIDADTNQIISGATVSVDGVTTASDTTNDWGEFLIYLYPGIYTVNASKTGYQDHISEDLLMEYDNTWAQIYLTPIGYGNGTLYGNVNDADTGYVIKDVHVIITNATDQIDAYTSSGGYYEATGLAQSSTYTIQAVKSGYYTYNGSVTTEASGASHKSFNMVPETATPTPTATVLPTSTYPGGEGHEWTNDEIVTMLRVLVPGFFLLMLVFLLLAVMLGIGGNNGNSGQGRSGLSEIWRRY